VTLKRLMIGIGVIVLLAGIGIAWLWEYAYTVEGRARNLIVVFEGRSEGVRAWIVRHHLTRPVVFEMPPNGASHLAAPNCLRNSVRRPRQPSWNT